MRMYRMPWGGGPRMSQRRSHTKPSSWSRMTSQHSCVHASRSSRLRSAATCSNTSATSAMVPLWCAIANFGHQGPPPPRTPSSPAGGGSTKETSTLSSDVVFLPLGGDCFASVSFSSPSHSGSSASPQGPSSRASLIFGERSILSMMAARASFLACHSAQYSASGSASTAKKRSNLNICSSSSWTSSSVRRSMAGRATTTISQNAKAGTQRPTSFSTPNTILRYPFSPCRVGADPTSGVLLD
mmetsp:Transcript_10269/g.18410  ORF Transcript_10269/g.18410 Transcript_10269/m.18410 type:complete len:242 (+) Transcript_10269:38-763(+)